MMNRNGTARDKNKRRTDSMIPKKHKQLKRKKRDDYNRDKLKQKNRGKNNNNNKNN
jgi:hypothetical protein